jgi:hypothetical protein
MSNGDAASGEFTVHELVIRVKRSRRVPLRGPVETGVPPLARITTMTATARANT